MSDRTSVPAPAPGQRGPIGWAAVFMMSVALLCWPGDLGGRDALTRYDTARALLHGHLAVDGSKYAEGSVGTVWYRLGPDGHVYGDYPLLHSLLMLPLIHLSDTERSAALLSPLLLLPWLALFYALLRRCAYEAHCAWPALLIVALTTQVLPYSINSHNNALQSLITLAATYALLHRGPGNVLHAAWAGVAFGALFNVRLWAVASVPMVLFLLVDVPDAPTSSAKEFLSRWSAALKSKATLLRAAAFALGASPLLVLFFWYEWLRFGDPLGGFFTHGSTLHDSRPWLGWLGLLVSPSKAILLFSPTLLLGILLMPRLFRRAPRIATACILGAGSTFAMTSVYFAWHGDVCWGPRYMLPAIPLLCLPLAELFAGPRATAPKGVRPLIAFGLLIQLTCVSVHPFRFFIETGRGDADLHGPNAVAHVFSLEASALSSGLLALPQVVSCSIDGWLTHFAHTDAEARQLDELRHNPRVDPELREDARRQSLLRRNKVYNTLTYWWVTDNILPQPHSWPRSVSWIAVPLLLLLVAVSAYQLRSSYGAGPRDP